MQDIEMQCQDCSKPFVFTVRDQEFFAQNQFTPPKRCFKCRQEKKRKRAEQEQNVDGRQAF